MCTTFIYTDAIDLIYVIWSVLENLRPDFQLFIKISVAIYKFQTAEKMAKNVCSRHLFVSRVHYWVSLLEIHLRNIF